MMPNVWTHLMFAERIAKKTPLDFSKEKNLFSLGAQGPDFFFYHSFWPWKKKKSMEWIGSKIHTERCGPFLMEMIRYLKKHPDDERLKNYVFGFISHHILDRQAHPYIIYRSGHDSKRHSYFEILIDTVLMKEMYQIQTWNTPVYHKINIGDHLPHSIRTMFVHIIENVYQLHISHLDQIIDQSYRDMITALKFLYDPSGLKKRLLRNQIASYSYSKQLPDKDILNVNHQVWLDPTNKEEVYTDSFYDILDRAEEEGVKILQAIENFLTDAGKIQLVESLIGNISYETGKPCDQKAEIRYVDPIV